MYNEGNILPHFSMNKTVSSEMSDEPEKDATFTPTADIDDKAVLEHLTDEELLKELDNRSGSLFNCPCGMIFAECPMFFLHRNIHVTDNPMKCAHCDQQFHDWYSFVAHPFRGHFT